MADDNERSDEEIMHRSDPRWTEVPQPCQHCKHLLTAGNQFDEEGWTCKAYPTGIPYTVLTLREPHSEPDRVQPGEMVAYDPVIYTEADTGRQWHYTADAGWKYLDEA